MKVWALEARKYLTLGYEDFKPRRRGRLGFLTREASKGVHATRSDAR
jgi:hypothetical protein